MQRQEIADLIVKKMQADIVSLKDQYQETKNNIGYFYVDNLLPELLVQEMWQCFPKKSEMQLYKSLKENKYVSAQMNQHASFLEEALFAFQDARVVQIISEICEIKSLFPDPHLYAGGISLMENGQFLNPHLDNSHDKDRKLWRVLNLLFYITPSWMSANGGNLELWPEGPKKNPMVIISQFNRLVVMVTHGKSWHSVSPIDCSQEQARCCISNYYFSEAPLTKVDSFHITSFRGRPEQKIRDMYLRMDIGLRMIIRTFFKKGIFKPKHVYKQ